MKKLFNLILILLLITSPVFSATLEVDYMEYASNATAAAAWVTNASGTTYISNADIVDEDMADITDWTDYSQSPAATSQATFDSKSTMKLLTGATVAKTAQSYRDVGTFGTRTVISFPAYFSTLGTLASWDFLQVEASDGPTQLKINFCSDGLFVFDGAAKNEVGTDIVSATTWQEWTFDVNWTAQTVDVYLNKVLQTAGVDCSANVADTNGTIKFRQLSETTANRLCYLDWLKAGSAFATATPALQSYSEATIKTQGSYSLKGVAAITDSLNKTLTKTFAVNSNLTGVKNLRLDAYALRTGSQWTLGIHDTGGTTTTFTPVIATSNTWQPVNCDLSAVSDANKDAIDTATLTITNAGSANTIFLDYWEIAQAIDVFGWVN